MMEEDTKEYRVQAIKEGTVIDHIPKGKALKACEVLNLNKEIGSITVGINFKSKKYGSKDFIKIEDKELSQIDVNKLALLAPEASVNIIKDYKVIKKTKVDIPEIIINIVKCPNPNCITNHEDGLKTKFILINKQPLKLGCNYCEITIKDEEIILR
jgi:aspartate carbamoyltransferase regulatory subunit